MKEADWVGKTPEPPRAPARVPRNVPHDHLLLIDWSNTEPDAPLRLQCVSCGRTYQVSV